MRLHVHRLPQMVPMCAQGLLHINDVMRMDVEKLYELVPSKKFRKRLVVALQRLKDNRAGATENKEL